MARRCSCGCSVFPEGVPLGQLLPLLLLSMCEAYSSSSVMSYSGFIVLDFVRGATSSNVGYYAGLLTSTYFFFQFVSSPVMGFLSDRIGRKPILLVGTCGNFISTLLMGFSWNFPWAVAARSLNGLLNGNVSQIKAAAADLTGGDTKRRNTVFSNILLANGIGSILGGMTGGLLVRPAIQYPSVFSKTGLFGRFPYLLPNFVCAVMLLVAAVLIIAFLKNDGGKKKKKQQQQQHSARAKTTKSTEGTPEDLQSLVEPKATAETSEQPRPTKKRGGRCCCCRSTANCSELKSNKTAIAVLLLYPAYGTAMTIYRTMMPMWSMAPQENGGLSFTASLTGTIFSIAGAMVLPVQLVFYPLIVRRIGLLWCFRLGCTVCVISFGCTPLLSLACGQWGHGTLFWVFFSVLLFCWQFGTQHAFASVNTLVSNSVPKKSSGTANGLTQSLASLGRALGPASFTPLFAWSISNGHSFPLNVYFPFLILASVPILTAISSLWLPKRLDSPFAEPPPGDVELVPSTVDPRTSVDSEADEAGMSPAPEPETEGAPKKGIPSLPNGMLKRESTAHDDH